MGNLVRHFLFAIALSATFTIWMPGSSVLLVLEALLLSGCAVALLCGCGMHRKALPGLWPVPTWGAIQLVTGTTEITSATVNATLNWASLAAAYLLARTSYGERLTAKFVTPSTRLAIAVVAVGALQWFTSGGRYFWIWDSGSPSVFGPFSSRNHFATYAVLFLPAVVWKAVQAAAGWWWALGGAMMFASLVASGSRGGVAAAMLVLGVTGFVLARDFRDQLRKVALFAAGATLLCLAFGWEILAAKLKDNDPLRYRREMISSAAHMLVDQPLWGSGLGSFQGRYPAYAQFDSGYFVNSAHCDWLEWGAEGGIPLLAFLVLFFGSTVRAALRSGWGIGLVGVYLHACVDYPFARFGVAIWVVLVAAAAEAFSSRSRSPT